MPAPLIINTLPKAGTHLLLRLFEGLERYTATGDVISAASADGCEDADSGLRVGVSTPRGIRRRAFEEIVDRIDVGWHSTGHIPYSSEAEQILEGRGVRLIVLLRDPRAVACSFVHFVMSRPHHVFYPRLSRLPTFEAQLASTIEGLEPVAGESGGHLLPVAECFHSVAAWADWRGAQVVFFEDLVGPLGGGGDTAQVRAIDAILNHVDHELPPERRRELTRTIYSPDDPFFRKGQIDEWREWFTPALHDHFESHAAGALSAYRSLRTRAS